MRPAAAFKRLKNGKICSTCKACGISKAKVRHRSVEMLEFLDDLERTRDLMTNQQFGDGLVAGIGIAIFRLRNRLGMLNV